MAAAFLSLVAAAVAADTRAQDAYGPVDSTNVAQASATGGPAEACPPPVPGGEIVVCAENEDPAKYRVAATPRDGTGGDPRAPNLETQYPMVGPGVTFKGCFIPPCPPPMPTLIDLKAIPEAPPGSDADRVARGLAPRGRDDETVRLPESASPAAPR